MGTELLTYLILIIIGYFIAKMLSRMCSCGNSFSVGAVDVLCDAFSDKDCKCDPPNYSPCCTKMNGGCIPAPNPKEYCSRKNEEECNCEFPNDFSDCCKWNNEQCVPKSKCEIELEKLCGKVTKGEKCYTCAGTHQMNLRGALCKQKDFNNFCNLHY